MIITAMYLYGIIQGAWSFDVMHIIVAFFLDLVLVSAFGSDNGIKAKLISFEKGAKKEE